MMDKETKVNDKPLEFIKTKNGRGFKSLEFKDYYSRECAIQESSCVIPQIWLGINHSERLLLDKKQARQLGKLLIKFSKGKLFKE